MSEQPGSPRRCPLVLAAGSMLDQPAEVVIDAGAAAGFDAVGLRLSAEHRSTHPAVLRSRAADRGIEVFDVEVIRLDGVTDAKMHGPLLDAAAAIGAKAVLVVADCKSRDETVRALAALTELTEAAAQVGLLVGFEYMAFTWPPDPIRALAVAEEAGCSLLVDVLHHARLGAGVGELDRIVAADRLGWLQICDAPLHAPATPGAPGTGAAQLEALVHEARHTRLPPGEGGLELSPLLQRLPVGTPISVEVQNDRLLAVEPEARARLLFDATRSVLGHAFPESAQ